MACTCEQDAGHVCCILGEEILELVVDAEFEDVFSDV